MGIEVKQLGQLFVVGFAGVEPPRPFLSFLSEEQIGGVILFEFNCPSLDVARDTIAEIRSLYKGSTPFVAVDQEGGRISRLRGAPAEFRGASEYAAEGSVEKFREEYRRSVVFMEALGVNVNLAPVCDIYSNGANSCLAERCYGTTAQEVIPFVEASVQTARAGGLLSCLKHFPGLGSSGIDPHFKTAVIPYEEMIWEQQERLPFAAGVSAGADMVMTTHVRLLGVDDIIATGSRKIVKEMLRGRLGFDGPVITDDMTMAGAAELGEIGPRTVKAFNAGHDILLFGWDYEQAIRAYDYFVDAFRRGDVSEDRVQAALDRVSGVKFKLDSSVLP